MIIELYIFLSYMIMLGMMIEEYSSLKETSSLTWVIFIFSPLTFPLLIGMELTNDKTDEKNN
jgi:hypothetical protein